MVVVVVIVAVSIENVAIANDLVSSIVTADDIVLVLVTLMGF